MGCRAESGRPVSTITGATQANPCVITVTGHAFANGDLIYIDSVSGMTELNGNVYTVANQATNTVELSGTDSSGYTAYTSGGTANGGIFFKVSGFSGAVAPAMPPYLAGNYCAISIPDYISNANSVWLTNLDNHNVKDIAGESMNWRAATTIASTSGSDWPLTVLCQGTGRGLRIDDSSGNLRASFVWNGGSTSRLAANGSALLNINGIKGLTQTGTAANNFRGSATFATSGTVAVSFGTAESDTSYYVSISGDANETYWITSKATGGFTINSSNASSTATVDWVLVR